MLTLTQDMVKSILDYDPEMGNFRWKISRGRVCSGSKAGCIKKDGYHKIKIGKKLYQSHRLAFIWMTGSCPDIVDHKNCIRSDNRWSNLRPATHQQNMRNRKSSKNSSSIYLGVYWREKSKKWISQIKIDGRTKYLGSFHKEIEAAKSYDHAAKEIHGNFSNLNFSDTHDE